MADANQEEQPKKSGILKIILFTFGGVLLIVIGLGIGYFLFGGEPETDPSAEVNQIIDGEPKPTKGDEEKKGEGEEEGEDGIMKKNVKEVPEVDAYETTYFEFPGDFTTNLKNSKKFLLISTIEWRLAFFDFKIAFMCCNPINPIPTIDMFIFLFIL